MGKNILSEVGWEVAQTISKENPESYAGRGCHRTLTSILLIKKVLILAWDSMVKEYVNHSRAST